MDGVAISIIGRPRPLPGHDTPNPANNTYTLNYEEPHYRHTSCLHAVTLPRIRICNQPTSNSIMINMRNLMRTI